MFSSGRDNLAAVAEEDDDDDVDSDVGIWCDAGGGVGVAQVGDASDSLCIDDVSWFIGELFGAFCLDKNGSNHQDSQSNRRDDVVNSTYTTKIGQSFDAECFSQR